MIASAEVATDQGHVRPGLVQLGEMTDSWLRWHAVASEGDGRYYFFTRALDGEIELMRGGASSPSVIVALALAEFPALSSTVS